MIHRHGRRLGQASDIEIHARHILKVKDKLNTLSKHTGQDLKTIEKTHRDNFMSADEAKKYA